MRSLNMALVSALLLAGSACSEDSTNSLGSDNGDAGAGGSGDPASGGSTEAGASTIDDETGGSAGSGVGGSVGLGGSGTGGDPGSGGSGTGGDPGSGGSGTGGDPGIGGGGFSASGGNWLSTGGNGIGGAVGSGGEAGSAGNGTGGDPGSGGNGLGGDVGTGGVAGSAGNGTGGDPGSGGTGTGGGGTGGDSGDGGAGGFECPPLPSCNWCGGEDIIDANGCIAGWICANGIDPCENPMGPCYDATDCEDDEVCEDDLCWPDTPAALSVATFEWIGNPCTTDPCLPGMVAGIIADPPNDITYVIVDNGSWVWQDGSWDGFDGFVPLDGQAVMASGRIIYHTDIYGHIYLEVELTNLTPRIG